MSVLGDRAAAEAAPPEADRIEGGVADGLSSEEARRRLALFGPNATPEAGTDPLRRALDKLVAPVPLLLEAAILLQLALGEDIEAAIIALLLAFNAVLGYVHEGRAQATLAALKARLALTASVCRDGLWRPVPAAELVPGDVVALSLGSVVAADVRLLDGAVLLDQSTVTGESLPVEAGPGAETYAGALVRRGAAIAEVTATGTRTKFGHAAELVRTAHAASTQQKAVLRVARNLAGFNGLVTALIGLYAYHIAMPLGEALSLVLIAVLASIPVALPATFTLAAALGAQALARRGVLPTRLSAVDEAASMDLLCSDKTGTLTRNELAVTAVRALPGFSEAQVLALAALASAESGQDPVDAAIRHAAGNAAEGMPKRTQFVPFDPATKMAEATAVMPDGALLRIVKGAFAVVAGEALPSPADPIAAELEAQGFRVLGVASGRPGELRLAGLVALSDPPRADAAALIAALQGLGVQVVMVTGDAQATAAVVARAVGLAGRVYPPGALPERGPPPDGAVFAGVLPEDKYRLVKALQSAGHVVGMCGDGANDAPALRQAQMGVAVATATDVAKSAAGIVLTEPGLGGILAAVREGRTIFQRVLTYALRSMVHKVFQVPLLGLGLVMTGHAILTPLQMVLLMITGDFLAMSATTDNVRSSPLPNAWRIGRLTIAGIVLGGCCLVFNGAVLAVAAFALRFPVRALRTLTLVTLVFTGQAIFYAVRERRHLWSSCPSLAVVLSSLADLSIVPALALGGVLMAPLSVATLALALAATAVFAFALDIVKLAAFRRLGIA